MLWILWPLLSLHSTHAQDQLVERIQETRAEISEAEKKQREALSNLFVINRKIKDISRKRARLGERALAREGAVRELAQEVHELEARSERQKETLNHRLRRLYHERSQDSFQWLFAAKSPVEFERNHRFLKKIIATDHEQLKSYLAELKELRSKREQLKGRVIELARAQKEIDAQERELAVQLKEKSRLVAEIRRAKDSKLNALKGLRDQHGVEVLSYAFFERKGSLRPPIESPLVREYGTYVDPQHRFKLMHKGLFYRAPNGSGVYAVAEGRVALAAHLPGYGKSVIVDHGDNYYSFYGFNRELKVREGARVREGDVLAYTGAASPLFGPGLYFEIRHFTDAIDPRNWIKESVIKTANR